MTKLIALSFLTIMIATNDFKTEQKKYPRVREAYKNQEASAQQLMKKQSLSLETAHVYLRSFKKEKELELWAKNAGDDTYKHIKTYVVCANSGELGPKRKQGDRQVPEGFYHIDRFNPYSNYHLSLGINYPNPSDRILGIKGRLGGDIFIHGKCVTIGCIPIMDEQIEELYLICVEAKGNGQNNIPVTIFPARLSDQNYASLIEEYKDANANVALWADLKKGFDHFNQHKKLPSIRFLSTGRHAVTP